MTDKLTAAIEEIRATLDDQATAHRLAGIYFDSRYSSQSVRADRIEADVSVLRDQLAECRREIAGLAKLAVRPPLDHGYGV